MPVIGRGLDDLIIDGIVAKLAAWRTAQVAMSAAVNFDIERDRSAVWQDLDRPLVVIEGDSDTPDTRSSAGRGPATYTMRVKFTCLTPATADGSTGASRFYYLKEQVRVALLNLSDVDMGQAVGKIGRIGLPTWSRVSFDDTELDTTILAGTWTLDLTYPWEPTDITGPALAQVQIDTAKWSAAYIFGD